MSDPRNYTIGWICAIEVEYTAAQTFLDNEHDSPDRLSPYDTNHYTLGDIVGHNVVMAVLPDGEYGTNSAASVVTNMLSSFPNIRIGLMVGIGGGAPTSKDDIRLGDVVVSSPKDGLAGVYQYDYGKTIQGVSFFQTGFLNQPSTIVRSAVTGLKSKYRRKGHSIERTIESILDTWPRLKEDFSRPPPQSDHLYVSSFVHTDGKACDESCALQVDKIVPRQPRQANHDNPYVHHGIIASGNQLMKDALIRDQYAKEKHIMCFEMEAAGIMNRLPCLVIRGICDYSDSHKSESWQGYAAMAAAAYSKDLLREIHQIDCHSTVWTFTTEIEAGGNTRSGTKSADSNISSESGRVEDGNSSKTHTGAYESSRPEATSKGSRNTIPQQSSQYSTLAAIIEDNPNLKTIFEKEDADASDNHTSLELGPLEKAQPQWTTLGWFDRIFQMQGLCSATAIFDSEALIRMISADENIKLEVVELTVQSRLRPFIHGPVRTAFYARTQASRSQFVLKAFITGANDDRARVVEYMRTQTLCKAFALEFNGLLEIHPPLDFIMTSCLRRKSTTASDYMSLERFVEGGFVKYNNNAGWVNEDLSDHPVNQAVQAFSHFTFERSLGALLVNNISGANHLLISPTIHTRDNERLKLQGTNFNESGFKLFFLTHRCNRFCHELGLKSNQGMFASGKFEFRTMWPVVAPTVCCSNKLCRSIIRMVNSFESVEFIGYRWCGMCWEQLHRPAVRQLCNESGPKHDFEVSRFFYESQGQLSPRKCPDHRGKDTPPAAPGDSIWDEMKAASSEWSRITNSSTYDTDGSQSNIGSDGIIDGVTRPPPPPPPKLHPMRWRARRWFARKDLNEDEKLENQRLTLVHEAHLAAYHRRYGR